jgi:hypothetical protein
MGRVSPPPALVVLARDTDREFQRVSAGWPPRHPSEEPRGLPGPLRSAEMLPGVVRLVDDVVIVGQLQAPLVLTVPE